MRGGGWCNHSGLSVLFFTFILIKVTTVSGQDSTKFRVRNVIWTTPVGKNTTINGISIGLMAIPWMKADSLKINGLNLEVSPFGALNGFYAIVGTLFSPFHFNKKDTLNDDGGDLGSNKIFPDNPTYFLAKIKGLSISGGGMTRNTWFYGVGINGVIGFADKMQGIEITGMMNLHYEFKGVMIAGLRNKVTTGKGVQIGLINTCKQGQVFQVGLINRIGNRIIPLVNFSLKK